MIFRSSSTHLSSKMFEFEIALQEPTMRQQHSCISHGSNVEHNALRSWYVTMYKFVTSMVLCGLGMQQCAMHNATIQKTTFFELGVSTNTHE